MVFCSSSYTIDRKYNDAAREFVGKACAAGYSIVSGGAVKGTMGVISEEVARVGGWHKGVIPRFMEEFEYPGLSEVVWTDTMAQRKEEMRRGTCAAVALPGGIGTFDELIETMTLAKLSKYDGKIFALNVDGFYDKFIELLDYLVVTQMLPASSRAQIAFPKSADELMELLEA